MKDFIIIDNGMIRIERVKKDDNGYYIEKGLSLFTKPNKQYLTENEVIEYKDKVRQNKAFQERQDAIAEARKEGRYKTSNQVIKKSNDEIEIIAYENNNKNAKEIKDKITVQ